MVWDHKLLLIYITCFSPKRGYFGAQNNDDYPEIIIDSIPVPDFISDKTNYYDAKSLLISRIKKLDTYEVDIIGLACNTAHLLYPELVKRTKVFFPSLIDLVCQQALKKKYHRVGILATPTTIRSKLYQNSLKKLLIKPIVPKTKTINYLEKIIRKVINGHKINKNRLYKISVNFIKENNLDGLILGCTELPYVFPRSRFSSNQIIDCLDILADTLINYHKC